MKISVIGGGNAGCITALNLGWATRWSDDIEVELIYDPNIPPEPVGQASVLGFPKLIWAAAGFNWYNNPFHATLKSGILYEGWGKRNDKVFHDFPSDKMAMHFCPCEMQEYLLKSKWFNVVEGNVTDTDSIDSDYIFDCRGKPHDYSDYDELISPTNACILGRANWDTTEALWSRHVATPDGWTFVIPTAVDSPSRNGGVGYCYNSNITQKEEAEYNFLEMFDVEITNHVNYKNYVAKQVTKDGRVFLNGNRLFFLEPLESTAIESYFEVSRIILQHRNEPNKINKKVRDYINMIQTFVMWHYQYGSKYDTPFWREAKDLTFIRDEAFIERINLCKKSSAHAVVAEEYGGRDNMSGYGQWPLYSFKRWYDGMNK